MLSPIGRLHLLGRFRYVVISDCAFQCGEPNVENQNSSSASEVAVTKPDDGVRMVDIPLSPDTKVTVERRRQIVLIGINRPQVFNRIDPDTFCGLASAYYE
jgi:hypothetical protein